MSVLLRRKVAGIFSDFKTRNWLTYPGAFGLEGMTWIDLAKTFNVRMYGRGLVCCMAIQGAGERESGIR